MMPAPLAAAVKPKPKRETRRYNNILQFEPMATNPGTPDTQSVKDADKQLERYLQEFLGPRVELKGHKIIIHCEFDASLNDTKERRGIARAMRRLSKYDQQWPRAGCPPIRFINFVR